MNVIKNVTVLSLAIFIGGCYSYDPIPEGIYKDTYTGLSEKERRGIPENCAVLTRPEAREIAKANNPNYLAMRHSMAAASARFHQSIAPYLPTVTANYNMYEYKNTPRSRGGRGSSSRRYTQKSSGLTARLLIFDGLMRTMNMLAAKHDQSQSEALYRDALRLLMQAVRIAYNNIILAQDRIRIAKADELFNKQLYGDTKLKYEAGAVPLTDLLNFEMKMHDAESAVLTQEYNFFTSRSILAELMGLTNAILPEKIFPKLTIDEEQFSIDVNTYLDTALLNRPDLKAYREALLSSKYKVAARWGAFMPTLNASASWGHQRNDWDTSGRWHFRNQAQNQSFDYGFDAEWVLFNGGKRIFDLREAQADLAVSKQKLAEHWISVVAEVRQTYADLTQKFKQTVIFKQNLTLNKQTRELINEAYKAGNASITRLNEVQRNLVVAETNLSTAVIDLENAKAKLKGAIGSTD